MDVLVVELRFVQACDFPCYIGSGIEIIMNIADATRAVITTKGAASSDVDYKTTFKSNREISHVLPTSSNIYRGSGFAPFLENVVHTLSD